MVQIRFWTYLPDRFKVSVTKAGNTDIWMVYNGISIGMKEVLWTPHFRFTTFSTCMRVVKYGTHISKIDIGEYFLVLLFIIPCGYIVGWIFPMWGWRTQTSLNGWRMGGTIGRVTEEKYWVSDHNLSFKLILFTRKRKSYWGGRTTRKTPLVGKGYAWINHYHSVRIYQYMRWIICVTENVCY